MPLPTINLNPISKNMDTSKQFAAIRSQIAQLRDAFEESLNGIGYENLNADLRRRIDNLDKMVVQNGELSNIIAGTIKADYASIDNLNALSAVVNTINANYVSTHELVTDYLTAGYISALGITVSSANITGKLEASQIKAEDLNVKAANITGKIKANQLDAQEIASDLFSGETIVCDNVAASNLLQGKVIASTQTFLVSKDGGGTVLGANSGNSITVGNSDASVTLKGRTCYWWYDNEKQKWFLTG